MIVLSLLLFSRAFAQIDDDDSGAEFGENVRTINLENAE